MIQTATAPQPTHDDRLLSAALIAEFDHLLGAARSEVIHGKDILAREALPF